jgi:WASH complex subunit strumpellin
MLLLLDELIPGSTREKLVISYYRYKGGQSSITKINEVCKLCKTTGYIPANFNKGSSKKPKHYPEEYFLRFKIDSKIIFFPIIFINSLIKFLAFLIEEIITAIKDDDIFRNLSAYPLSDHRSAALANQASILYVLLYFSPEILQTSNTK